MQEWRLPTVAYIDMSLVRGRAEARFDLATIGIEVLADVNPSGPAARVEYLRASTGCQLLDC